jgi:hypothetical protein
MEYTIDSASQSMPAMSVLNPFGSLGGLRFRSRVPAFLSVQQVFLVDCQVENPI